MSFREQLKAKLFARPIIQIHSSEYNRVEQEIKQVAKTYSSPTELYTWSTTRGLWRLKNFGTPEESVDVIESDGPITEDDILYYICSSAQQQNAQYEQYMFDGQKEEAEKMPQRVFVLQGMNRYLNIQFDENAYGKQDYIKRVEYLLRVTRGSMVLVDEDCSIPKEIRSSINTLDFPLPGESDIRGLISEIQKSVELSADKELDGNLDNEEMDRLVHACKGLASRQISDSLAEVLNLKKKFDPQVVQDLKIETIKRTGNLDYYPPDESLSELGGMDIFKKWVKQRKRASSEKAKEFGLPRPKGIMLIGVPGCGKSLAAKVISAYWGVPLLGMSIQDLKGSLVGESEQNLRQALNIAKAASPCILWIDEIEKGFAGSGQNLDSGVSTGLLGQFLTFMQECKEEVFVIATANRVQSLPPELMRKGRFDDLFFVDLPTEEERKEIFRIHIQKAKQRPPYLNPDDFDIKTLAKKSKHFSGAEIEACVKASLFPAFAQDREVKTSDILHQVESTVPQVKTSAEDIAAIRNWADGRARNVSSQKHTKGKVPKRRIRAS